MTIPEVRQVILVNGRALHLRRFGCGRPVVMLHESPRSSVALLPLATRLADHFTVFALDTPGYGYSDPLALHHPEITDFADAIAGFLRALGLARVPVYGTHTGATIAAEMGRRHPDLVAGLVLDGFPVFTVSERDLHHTFYLPQFAPRWDGSHVVALWTRVRDQFDFFPWYALNEDARLRTTKASLERHRSVLRDFLAAGETYSVAYAASFRFEALSALRDLRVPTHVMAREVDVLFSHLQRLGPLPDGCRTGVLPVDPDEWAAAIRTRLAEMSGDAEPPRAVDLLEPSPHGQKGVFDGRLLCRCYGRAGPQLHDPVVLLHDTPGSALEWNDVATRLAADRLVIVPELPNHGLSPEMEMGDGGLQRLGHCFRELFSALGGKISVVGRGLGSVLGDDLAATQHTSIQRTIAIPDGAAGLASCEPVDAPLAPRWDGADLLADWFAIRDRALYGPGSDARTGPGPLTEIGFDVPALHERFRARTMAAGQDRLYEMALRLVASERKVMSAPTIRLRPPNSNPLVTPAQISGQLQALLDRNQAR